MKNRDSIRVMVAPDKKTGVEWIKKKRCEVAIVQYYKAGGKFLADVYGSETILLEISRVSKSYVKRPHPVAGVQCLRFLAEASRMRDRIAWQFSRAIPAV